MPQAPLAEGAPAGRPGSRLRVTVVQHGGVLGGAERWQLDLAAATERLDIDVIAIGEGATTAEWEARGVPVAVVPDERRSARLPGLAMKVGALLRQSSTEVVVAHGVRAGMMAAPAARALGIPLVRVRHDPSSTGALSAFLDRVSDGQVTVSSSRPDGSTHPHSLVLNPPRPGVQASGGSPPREAARRRLGISVPAGRFLLGMATRITQGKGIDDAIRALADPAARRWDLAVAGIQERAEAGEQDRLIALAEGLGVADRVRFLRPAPDVRQVAGAFDAIAVLAKPSETMPGFRDAFGMTALEAITAGVPVVATPPVDEIVSGGGIAVRPDAPGEVAGALRTLEDADVRRRVAQAAVRRALEFPDAEEAAGRFVDFLAGLAHRPGVGLRDTLPSISVVTTVLNDEQALKEMLGTLVPQLGEHDELVVVDAGSSDGSAAVVTRIAELDPRVRLIVEPGAGISRGRNLGIATARHEAIACTDAGCIPVPEWLDSIRQAFARHPEIELWTGTMEVEAQHPWELALKAVGYPAPGELSRRTPLVRLYARVLGSGWEASMPTGRSVAFRREGWTRAGGFPEDLQTGEDVLFGRRLVAAGGSARMVRDAEVSWAQRPTFRANLKMLRRYGEGSGNSLDRRLLGRDLTRVVAYATGAGVMVGGRPRTRAVVAVGGLAYLSQPLSRALRGPAPLHTAALVPPVAAARDLVKAYGALSAAARHRRRTGTTRTP